MGRFSAWAGASILTAVFGFAGALVVAADDPPAVKEGPWRIVLEGQIKKEKGCDIKEVLMYQEIPLGDETGIEGRVSCIDGRQFDFSRNRSHQKFRIEMCEPAVC